MRGIKKIFLPCVSLIALFACERAIDDIPQNKVHSDIDVPFSNYDVTEGMAKRLAMIVAKEDIVEILPLTFGYSDTLLYAIDFNKGWLLLSADMRAKPILAKSSDGHFTDKEGNHGFKTLIDMYADNIRRIKDDDSQMTANDLSNNPESSMWLDIWRLENTPAGRIKTRVDSAYAVHERIYLCKRLTSSSITDIEPSAPINHFIETKWGQGQPWNSMAHSSLDTNVLAREYDAKCIIQLGNIRSLT
jgi:hypothetical protein